jgi:hypothetical protein
MRADHASLLHAHARSDRVSERVLSRLLQDGFGPRILRGVAIFVVAFVTLFVGSMQNAYAAEPLAGPTPTFIGDGKTGLPSIGRVAVVNDRGAPRVTLAAGAGYGFTESLVPNLDGQLAPFGARGPGGAGSHHRLSGSLAVAFQPLTFLSAALMFDGRFDKHPDDANGSSSSTLGEGPRLFVRAGRALSPSMALGGQLGVWVPGAEAPSFRFDATTIDAVVIGTLTPPKADLAVSINAGFRLDQSGKSVDRPASLRPGDRLSLMVSDSNAVLVGVGASKLVGAKVEVLADTTWNILVGDKAPSAFDSPLRLGVGGRYHVNDTRTLQIEVSPEVVLSGRPAQGPGVPLVPIEPRFSFLVGARYTLPFGAGAAAAQNGETTQPQTNKPPPVNPMVQTVKGRITKEGSAPDGADSGIANAHVTITVTAADGTVGLERSADTGADGTFAIGDLGLGRAKVSVKAAGYEDGSAELEVKQGTPDLVIALKRVIKAGQLRGLVRSFNGKPLAATIRVEPLNVETKTDSDGTFQIDVPPGSYEVVIAAPGHAGQRRPVQVEENGVTILNADLRPGGSN